MGAFCFPTPPSSKGHFRQTHSLCSPTTEQPHPPHFCSTLQSDAGTEKSAWGWQALSQLFCSLSQELQLPPLSLLSDRPGGLGCLETYQCCLEYVKVFFSGPSPSLDAMPCSASTRWAFGISLSVFLPILFLRCAEVCVHCALAMGLCPQPKPWWHFIPTCSRYFSSWIFSPHFAFIRMFFISTLWSNTQIFTNMK